MLTKYDQSKDIEPYYPTVIDIETSRTGKDIGIGITYQDENNQRIYKDFECIADWFIWYIETVAEYEKDNSVVAKRLRRIFAHNGAAFDSLKIHEVCMELSAVEKAQYFMSNSAGIGYKVKYRRMKHAVTFMDSYRLLPSSLAKLSITFDIVHKKLDLDGKLPEDVKAENPTLYWYYLKMDCFSLQEILYKFWKMLYEKHGSIGDLPMTLPALAMRLFRLYIDVEIMTPNAKYQKTIERSAYHGGLTQCLEIGEYENVQILDVNSMYPYVMREYDYPTSYVGYITRQYNPDLCGLWLIDYAQEKRDIPPFIFDINNRVSYEGRAVCTTAEIEHLKSIGGTFSLIEGRVWAKTGPIFRSFIDDFYASRKLAIEAGDDALAFVIKILLNSVYGKFAEREIGHKVILASGPERRKIIAEAGEYYSLGNFIAVLELRRVNHAFVGIAAMITAYARITLHRLIVDMIDKGYKVVYCDTDSVHVATGQIDVDVGTELGQTKLEYSGCAVYAGKKLYATQKSVKAKGVGRAIKQGNLTYQIIQKLALENGKERIQFETFPTVKEVLGEKRKAAVMLERFRTIRATGTTPGYTPRSGAEINKWT